MDVTSCRSETAIVILHEIYGINTHISSMRRKFEELGFDTYCMDFFDGRIFGYEDSEEAYSYFRDKVGLDQASIKVLDLLKSIRCQYEKIFLIGYSVGATVAWLCSKEKDLVDGIVGYYGSRIRDYLKVNPEVETLLFFPMKEKSFEIDDLVEKLDSKDMVSTRKFEGLHGFADAFSVNYNSKSKALSEEILIEFISK